MRFIVPSLNVSHYCFNPPALVMSPPGRLKNPLLRGISLLRHLDAISKPPLHLQRRKGRSCQFKAAPQNLARSPLYSVNFSSSAALAAASAQRRFQPHRRRGRAPSGAGGGRAGAGARLPHRICYHRPCEGGSSPRAVPRAGRGEAAPEGAPERCGGEGDPGGW